MCVFREVDDNFEAVARGSEVLVSGLELVVTRSGVVGVIVVFVVGVLFEWVFVKR